MEAEHSVGIMEVYRRVWEMERRLTGSPICLEPGCESEAVCNYVGFVDMPAYCERHATYEMDRLPEPEKHRGCNYMYQIHVPGLDPARRCNRVAVTGFPRGRKDRCVRHVGPERKWKPNQMCHVAGCWNLALYGFHYRQISGSCENHKVNYASMMTVKLCEKCKIPMTNMYTCTTCGDIVNVAVGRRAGICPPPPTITHPDELVSAELGFEEKYGVNKILTGEGMVIAIDHSIYYRRFEAFVDIPRFIMISRILSERYPKYRVILIMTDGVHPQKIRDALERVVTGVILDSTLIIEVRRRNIFEHAE